MAYVVVIRREGAINDLGKIYRGRDIGSLVARLYRKYGRGRKSVCTTPEIADYIRKNYGKMSAQEIADELSFDGVRVTKNMVVGHAHRAGLSKRKDARHDSA